MKRYRHRRGPVSRTPLPPPQYYLAMVWMLLLLISVLGYAMSSLPTLSCGMLVQEATHPLIDYRAPLIPLFAGLFAIHLNAFFLRPLPQQALGSCRTKQRRRFCDRL